VGGNFTCAQDDGMDESDDGAGDKEEIKGWQLKNYV